MSVQFKQAFIAGVERVSAWADLLDRINVYPVADGDTGRNLVISLSALRRDVPDPEDVIHELLLSARGNSGNIAARFFSSFLTIDDFESLPIYARMSRDEAWKAVTNPQQGTMLTLFDALAEILSLTAIHRNHGWAARIIDHLEYAVLTTTDLQPKLKQAGVVDAGALGMFIFFEGFFNSLVGMDDTFRSITSVFRDRLSILPSFRDETEGGYCVDTVIRISEHSRDAISSLDNLGDSITATEDGNFLKIHLHTDNEDNSRQKLAAFGDLVQWSADDLGVQVKEFRKTKQAQAIHIMTDAAGSVTRKDARQYGLTLLDSYITMGDKCLPETFFMSDEIYSGMKNGIKASTSQASVFERHQYYQSLLELYPRALYLCVGSVYTGNYETVTAWKKEHDPDNRLTVIDTGAASGRLGLAAISAARYAMNADAPDTVIKFAAQAVERCEEYIFVDTLRYLAAGGRLSKTGAFFGNILNMKPVITPTAEGAQKVGMVHDKAGQLAFTLEKLANAALADDKVRIMLEYTDNLAWIQDIVLPEVKKRYPLSSVITQPLSLTTGVHTGPGTWGVAWLPETHLSSDNKESP